MAGDSELEILIKFGLDPTQARAAINELNAVKTASVGAQTAGGEAAKGHAVHIHGLHQALRVLGHEAHQMGNALSVAFYSLPTAGLVFAAIAIHKLIEAMKEWKKIAEEVADRNVKLMDSTRESTDKATESQRLFNKAMSDAGKVEDELKVVFAQKKELLAAEIKQKLAMLKVDEQLAIEEAKRTGGSEGDVRKRFEGYEKEYEFILEARKLSLTQEELEKRKQESIRLSKEANAAEAAQQTFLTNQRTEYVKSERDLLAKQKPEEAFQVEGGYTVLGRRKEEAERAGRAFAAAPSDENAIILSSARKRYEDMKKLADEAAMLLRANEELTRLATEEKILEEQKVQALKRFQTSATSITALTQQGDTEKRLLGVQFQTRLLTQFGPAGKDVANAAGGADAITAGGKATAEQADAMNKIAAMFHLSGQNVIAVLGKMNDSQAMFDAALKNVIFIQERIQSRQKANPVVQ